MSVYPTSVLSQFKENERGSFMNTEEINPHLTAKIVVNYMRHHRLAPDQLGDLITSVHRAIGQLGQPPELEEVLTPAVSVRRSVHRDYVICLDCGHRGKTLARHIATRHGLTQDEYRQRWGLRSNHLLTAPAFSERRSTLAKEAGFGRKPVANARRRHREPEGKTQAQISPSIEVECRERDGSSADARQKEAITRGRGCVVVTVAAALT